MGRAEPVFEVLILGAGPAGCAAALALLRAGVRAVLLVDRPRRRPLRIGESATPDCRLLLERLGLNGDLGALGHNAHYGNLSVWGSGRPAADPFLRRGWSHGWHLDRARFDGWLRAEAVARGAVLVCPAAVTAVAARPGGWQATVDGFGSLSARVVVDAGGRRAPLATRLGVGRHRLDLLVALAMQTEMCGAGLAGLSYVEAVADGWWYAVSLADRGAVVMLMTDRDIAAAREFRRPEVFAQAWRRTSRLAQLVPPPNRLQAVATLPAFSSLLGRAAGPRWIAAGDALMTFDPLASAGIAGALADGLAAAGTIAAWLGNDQPADAARRYGIRAAGIFDRYLRQRRVYYAAEPRWSNGVFWRRRTGRAADPLGDSTAPDEPAPPRTRLPVEAISGAAQVAAGSFAAPKTG